MALPGGLPLVAITGGPYNDYSGVPYSGTIEVTPSTPVIWAATGAVLLNGSVTFTADAAGAFSFSLPACDADGLTVQGFTYTFRFNLRSAAGEAQHILPIIVQLPEAAPVVDLDLLETIVSTTGISVGLPSVVSVAGHSGNVTGAHIVADATVAAALALRAPLASPALTGNPTAPTPSPGDNDTSIATSAFVVAAITAALATAGMDGGTA